MIIELRKIPIYRALNRSTLVLGCDRELLLMTALIVATLILVTTSYFSVISAVFLWFVVFALLRKMGKADPNMRDVYLRHIRYQAFYPAQTSPFAPSARWQRHR